MRTASILAWAILWAAPSSGADPEPIVAGADQVTQERAAAEDTDERTGGPPANDTAGDDDNLSVGRLMFEGIKSRVLNLLSPTASPALGQTPSEMVISSPQAEAVAEQVYVMISADLLRSLASKPVAERTAVREFVVGTPTRGIAFTRRSHAWFSCRTSDGRSSSFSSAARSPAIRRA